MIFRKESHLREIGYWAFCGCKSLQSIAILDSVIAIRYGAFRDCDNLESLLFTDQSCLQEIDVCAFLRCHSLQFINIPTTVTTINADAFAGCPVLLVIDIPHQAEVHPDAFKDWPLLERTFEEFGTDCMNGRFDALQNDQACFNFNNDTTHAENDSIVNYFHSLQDNDPALLQVDIMGMTPLYILCVNPAVAKNIIKQLYHKISCSSPKCK